MYEFIPRLHPHISLKCTTWVMWVNDWQNGRVRPVHLCVYWFTQNATLTSLTWTKNIYLHQGDYVMCLVRLFLC